MRREHRWTAIGTATTALAFAAVLPAHTQARLVLNPRSSLTTIAGNGSDKQTIGGTAAIDASIASPRGLAYDSTGRLYIADSRNHTVSRRDLSGTLTIIAGTGRQGYAGDGGPATSAELDSPSALAFDRSGNLLIADTANHCIRRIDPDGMIHTVVGTGRPGFDNDGTPATQARLRSPLAVAVSGSGDVYIADTGNHRIRKWGADGSLVTVAGNGAEDDSDDGAPALQSSLRFPSGLTMLSDGRLLIADREARRLRTLEPDGTLAAYGIFAATALARPEGITVDGSGDVYLADAGAQSVLQGTLDGTSILAGNGEQSAALAGSPVATPLDSPSAVATWQSSGTVAISDRRNHQVLSVASPRLDFGSIPAGESSTAQTVNLQNGGTTPLQVLAVTLPTGYAQSTVRANGCAAAPFTLDPAEGCEIAIVFHPTIQGSASGFAQVRVSGAAPQSVLLSGIGAPGASQAPSATALQTNGNISYLGTPVTFIAAVSGQLATPPAGNVAFLDGNAPLATIPLVSGTASLTTSALQLGQHSIRAMYSGDVRYGSSTSAIVVQTVAAAPDFVLSGSASSYSAKAGNAATIPLTLQPVNGTLNHAVQFAVTGLPNGATATFSPSTVTLAGDPITFSLTIQLAATTADKGTAPSRKTPAIPAALLFATGICGWASRRRKASIFILPIAACILLSGGCAGPLRTDSTTAPPSTSQSYTIVVAATTPGVTGAALTHSTSFGLVVTG